MHCWAAVSHYLDYKGEWDVPGELKMALSALGGLFYVADSEFQSFYSARVASSRKAEAKPNLADQEINLDTMSAYLRGKFPERKNADPKSVSELIHELKRADYGTIAQIDRDIARAADAFAAYEKEYPPGTKFTSDKRLRRGRGMFTVVGAARISLALASEKARVAVERGDKDDPLRAFVHLVKHERASSSN
jgi:putative GTP pyrophosphokinase